MKKLILIYILLQSVLQMSFLTAVEPELSELLMKDIQYYELVVKPRGKDACINYINMVIQKYEDKGIESMYLIPVKEELKKLQEKHVQEKRLGGFCKASMGTIFSNDFYKDSFIEGIKLGVLGSVIGGSVDVDYIETKTKNGEHLITMFPISVSFIVLPVNWFSFNIGGGYYSIDYSLRTCTVWYDASCFYEKRSEEKFENSFGYHAGTEFDIPIYKDFSLGINTKYLIVKSPLNTKGYVKRRFTYFYSFENRELVNLSSLVLTGGLKYKF